MSELREEFQREVPDAPSTHGWADGVRARRRRRRAASSAVALGVVAVVAVPLGISLMGRTGEPIVPAEPAPTSPATTDAPSILPAPVSWPATTHEEMCAASSAMEGMPQDAWVAVDDLPGGPARVWLCSADQAGGQPIVFPEEPLIAEDLVGTAIETFNALPEHDPNTPCTMEFGMIYTVLHEYPDGTVIPARGEAHGCFTVRTGPDDDQQVRSGAGEWLDALTGLWSEQRAAGEGQEPLGEEACRLGPSLVGAVDERLTSGYACDPAFEADGPTVEMDPQVVQQLVDVERDLTDGGLAEPLLRVVVVDDLGGSRAFSYDGEYLMDEGEWDTFGLVPDELRAELDPLVAATR